MEILYSLFPNFSDFIDDVPVSINFTKPWALFDPKNNDNLINQLIKINLTNKSSRINSPNNIFIHPNAIVDKNARIEAPCYIGDGAIIKHSAYLRPGSCICKGAVVGHSSEIKNAILLPFSKAPHFNYVGDSIIGSYSNLGAGVKIANIRHDKKSIDIKGEGFMIPTNLEKFGSLIGDNCSLGCNSVCNPGSILIPNSSTPPNSIISGAYDNFAIGGK